MTIPNSSILASLEAEFFGKEFFEEQELIDKVLSCTSLEEFEALELHKRPEILDSIFAAAGFTDPDAKILTADYLTRLYDDLPAVRNNSDFI